MDAEADLVARSLEGEGAAFARLVGPHQAVALRVAYAIVGSEAEDAVRTRSSRPTPASGSTGPTRLPPWLLAIVANEARNRRRGSGRHTALALRVAEQSREPEGDPAAEVVSADTRAGLLAAVATLVDRDREIVALRYFAELSEAETAAALGCPVGTVKSRLSRALARLRAELGEDVLA